MTSIAGAVDAHVALGAARVPATGAAMKTSTWRELCSALARSGTECDIFTRSWAPDLEPVVPVEARLACFITCRPAPLAPVRKEDLPDYIEAFADSVLERIEAGPVGTQAGKPCRRFNANYWLSGAAGHILKHRLELPFWSVPSTRWLV